MPEERLSDGAACGRVEGVRSGVLVGKTSEGWEAARPARRHVMRDGGPVARAGYA